jgi:hypothetical protein
MPSVVGQPRKPHASGSNACELAFGAQALQNRSEYTIKYLVRPPPPSTMRKWNYLANVPVHQMYHGVVSNWDMGQQLWCVWKMLVVLHG